MKKIKEFFRKLHQKRWIRFLTYSAFNIGLPGLGSYAHFWEVYRTQITKLDIPIEKLPKNLDGFKIIHLSDIHLGPTNNSTNFIRKNVELINQQNADIVFITGDFLQWDMKYMKPLAHLLSHIQSTHGIFASLGNHDYGVCHAHQPACDLIDFEEVIKILQNYNIKTLHNETLILKTTPHPLQLVGLGDFWTEHFKPLDIILKENIPTILLSHNPDSIEHLENFSFDLMLSGHAHGGQISFPFVGPLFVPIKHKHLKKGLHLFGKKWLFVNRGLGFTFKARLNSPPEIACLRLIQG